MKISPNVVQEAVKVAKTSNVSRGKIGAVLFKDNGHIITKCCNAILLGDKNNHTIHAEEFLLLKASKLRAFNRYGNLNMLVVRWRKVDGKLGNAKPCFKCNNFLKSVPNLNIYYSNIDGIINPLKF